MNDDETVIREFIHWYKQLRITAVQSLSDLMDTSKGHYEGDAS